MKKYEYKIVMYGTEEKFAEHINALGAEGFSLVGFTALESGRWLNAVMQREIDPAAEAKAPGGLHVSPQACGQYPRTLDPKQDGLFKGPDGA